MYGSSLILMPVNALNEHGSYSLMALGLWVPWPDHSLSLTGFFLDQFRIDGISLNYCSPVCYCHTWKFFELEKASLWQAFYINPVFGGFWDGYSCTDPWQFIKKKPLIELPNFLVLMVVISNLFMVGLDSIRCSLSVLQVCTCLSVTGYTPTGHTPPTLAFSYLDGAILMVDYNQFEVVDCVEEHDSTIKDFSAMNFNISHTLCECCSCHWASVIYSSASSLSITNVIGYALNGCHPGAFQPRQSFTIRLL